MPRHMQGMTLLELLVLIVILGLLATQGVPAMGHLLRAQRLQAASHTLYQALYYARSEAIRQGVPVLMISEQGGWTRGWRIFADRNDDGEQSPSETTLREGGAPPGGLRRRANRPLRHYVRYAPNGYSIRASGSFQIGSFYLCTAKATTPARRIVLSRGGRVRIERLPEGDAACAR
ncbi:type IV fimbrial biogenesis protein FimT [Chromohalobacter marismortui]|uniref:Type II secretion system protein H n=1 Tax=Chromohalobacter marismortui TaxID=42055 RepID=A0A4R7NF47_9GAMM|nr:MULTISPECIES: GspH/FimT family protein [Chromohalobacter]MCI0511117.1 GspH/FimT family protein [Chromohalobacter sp.]MCI0593221.1 GspH/FimT family protein [Chromohalobacter sp.]TDU19144.1 type IV fimbrial biogenesis protein FimT [Chromohalobacter marismortui]